MVSRTSQQGFGLLFALFLVAIIAVSLTAMALLATTEMKRDRERQLLFVGDAYRRAIREYYLAVPGQQHYPPTLQDLVEDPRFPMPVRYLREIYPDPISGKPFVLIRDPLDHGIEGVYSPAKGEPLKIANFPEKDHTFTGATSYGQWKFEFAPPASFPQPGKRLVQ